MDPFAKLDALAAFAVLSTRDPKVQALLDDYDIQPGDQPGQPNEHRSRSRLNSRKTLPKATPKRPGGRSKPSDFYLSASPNNKVGNPLCSKNRQTGSNINNWPGQEVRDSFRQAAPRFRHCDSNTPKTDEVIVGVEVPRQRRTARQMFGRSPHGCLAVFTCTGNQTPSCAQESLQTSQVQVQLGESGKAKLTKLLAEAVAMPRAHSSPQGATHNLPPDLCSKLEAAAGGPVIVTSLLRHLLGVPPINMPMDRVGSSKTPTPKRMLFLPTPQVPDHNPTLRQLPTRVAPGVLLAERNACCEAGASSCMAAGGSSAAALSWSDPGSQYPSKTATTGSVLDSAVSSWLLQQLQQAHASLSYSTVLSPCNLQAVLTQLTQLSNTAAAAAPATMPGTSIPHQSSSNSHLPQPERHSSTGQLRSSVVPERQRTWSEEGQGVDKGPSEMKPKPLELSLFSNACLESDPSPAQQSQQAASLLYAGSSQDMGQQVHPRPSSTSPSLACAAQTHSHSLPDEDSHKAALANDVQSVAAVLAHSAGHGKAPLVIAGQLQNLNDANNYNLPKGGLLDTLVGLASKKASDSKPKGHPLSNFNDAVAFESPATQAKRLTMLPVPAAQESKFNSPSAASLPAAELKATTLLATRHSSHVGSQVLQAPYTLLPGPLLVGSLPVAASLLGQCTPQQALMTLFQSMSSLQYIASASPLVKEHPRHNAVPACRQPSCLLPPVVPSTTSICTSAKRSIHKLGEAPNKKHRAIPSIQFGELPPDPIANSYTVSSLGSSLSGTEHATLSDTHHNNLIYSSELHVPVRPDVLSKLK